MKEEKPVEVEGVGFAFKIIGETSKEENRDVTLDSIITSLESLLEQLKALREMI